MNRMFDAFPERGPVSEHGLQVLQDICSEQHYVQRQDHFVDHLNSLNGGRTMAQRMLDVLTQHPTNQLPHERADHLAYLLITKCDCNPLVFNQSINKNSARMVVAILRALAQMEERGEGLRTPHGGNVLHHLGGNSEYTYLMLLGHDQKLEGCYCPTWINQRQDDGATPLLQLWKHVACDDPIKLGFWRISEALLARGAQIDACDNEGHDLLHWMKVARKTYPLIRGNPLTRPDEYAAMERFMAHVDALALHKATTQAPSMKTALRI